MSHWRLATWYFLYFAFIGAYMPYFGVYLQAQGFSAWDISLLLSLMQVMRLVAPNLWSQLAERLGRQAPVVRVTTLLCIACYSLLFFSQGFAQTFVAMALLAFFWSAALPLVEALTLSQLDRDQHAERYSRIRLWGSIGFVITVLCIGSLLDLQPIHSLLWASLALLMLLLVCTLALPNTPSHHGVSQAISYRAMFQRQPALQALLWACFLMAAAHGPLYVFYSIHLVAHAYTKTQIGTLWSLGVIAEILVFMWMPRILRRFPLHHILLATFAAATLRFLVIGWYANSLLLLILAQCLHGLTFGAFHAAIVAILHRWFPGREQSRAQALYGSISFGAGGLLGGLLSGSLWSSLGASWTYTAGALFALIGYFIIRHTLTHMVAISTRSG